MYFTSQGNGTTSVNTFTAKFIIDVFESDENFTKSKKSRFAFGFAFHVIQKPYRQLFLKFYFTSLLEKKNTKCKKKSEK